MASLPARVPDAEYSGTGESDPQRSRNRGSSVLPDWRRQDGGVSRSRSLHDDPAPAADPRNFLGRRGRVDALHAAPADTRPARTRGHAHLRVGARTSAQFAAWDLAVRGRPLGWTGGDAKPDGTQGRQRPVL